MDEAVGQTAAQISTAATECQYLSVMMRDFDLKLMNKKSAFVEMVSVEPRTLRGGQR